jgi:hypothetical protein
MVDDTALLIVALLLIFLYYEPKKENNAVRIFIPSPLETPKYAIGDMVILNHSNETCIYLGRTMTQMPMRENGKIVNKTVVFHRVVNLRDTTNPIDCEDFEIKPYQVAKYSPYKEEPHGTKPEAQ